jgi:hypothetical protein
MSCKRVAAELQVAELMPLHFRLVSTKSSQTFQLLRAWRPCYNVRTHSMTILARLLPFCCGSGFSNILWLTENVGRKMWSFAPTISAWNMLRSKLCSRCSYCLVKGNDYWRAFWIGYSIYWSQEDEIGRACSTNGGRREIHIGYWWENQKVRDQGEYQDVGGWTILKWSLDR